MTTFSASVRVDDGTLHVSRPLTAPGSVADLITELVDFVGSGDDVTSIELTVETAQESETPIGDSITGTSSTPINATAVAPDEDDEP